MIASAARCGPLVVIESPSRASAPTWLGVCQPLGVALNRWLNTRYAKRCELDARARGEHPYASELRGFGAGSAWGARGDVHAYYLDRGICHRMRSALRDALSRETPLHIEFRTLSPRRAWIPSKAELRLFASDTPPL